MAKKLKSEYTNDEVVSCGLADYGKPKPDGFQEQRYRVNFADGEGMWLGRVTTILKVIGKCFKQWAVDRAIDYLEEHWHPGVPYTPEQRALVLYGDTGRDEKLVGAKWAHKFKLQQAGDWGTQAHDYIERFLKTNTWVSEEEWGALDPEVQNSLTLFIDWWNKCKFKKAIHVEEYVYDLRWGYGGKFDYLAEDEDGNLHAIDWKTSGGIYGEYIIQVAAYVNGLYHSLGLVVVAAHIVRIGKVSLLPDVLTIDKDTLREAWRGFTWCVDLKKLTGKLGRICDNHRKEFLQREADYHAELEARAKEGAVDEQDTKEIWRRLLRDIKAIDVKLHTVLLECRPKGWDEGAWVLGIRKGFDWHVEQVRQHRELISQTLSGVFGRRVPFAYQLFITKGDKKNEQA